MNRRRRTGTNRKSRRAWGMGGNIQNVRPRRFGGNTRTKQWTPSEITMLKKFYRTNSNTFIAQKLGRSEGSVQYKASSLGLRKSPAYLKQIRNNWS